MARSVYLKIFIYTCAPVCLCSYVCLLYSKLLVHIILVVMGSLNYLQVLKFYSHI